MYVAPIQPTGAKMAAENTAWFTVWTWVLHTLPTCCCLIIGLLLLHSSVHS